ncbi:MAG: DUF1573 domain-containing protein, partial [Fibrobacterota bacterium]|nr:DUF1573 domain-containing protein [Chitinispirillaceae bacterium]
MNRVYSAVTVCFISVVAAFAGPKIEFDTKTFNCGVAIEGVTEKIQAAFVIKNTGDSALRLVTVKPGCGCTVVKFDSIIEPGKSTKIEAEVNIKGYHSGPLSKGITVVSNADKAPVRLNIEATIQAAIDLSENYLRFDSAGVKSKVLTLTSLKKDLKISSIVFNVDNVTADAKKTQKLPITYKFGPSDSTVAEGYQAYKLVIFAPKYSSSIFGTYTIATNHPDRKEILIRGN